MSKQDVNANAPQWVLTAVQRMYDFLPNLVGVEWPTVQPQIDAHLSALRSQPNAVRESAALVGLLARYEPARRVVY